MNRDRKDVLREWDRRDMLRERACIFVLLSTLKVLALPFDAQVPLLLLLMLTLALWWRCC